MPCSPWMEGIVRSGWAPRGGVRVVGVQALGLQTGELRAQVWCCGGGGHGLFMENFTAQSPATCRIVPE